MIVIDALGSGGVGVDLFFSHYSIRAQSDSTPLFITTLSPFYFGCSGLIEPPINADEMNISMILYDSSGA